MSTLFFVLSIFFREQQKADLICTQITNMNYGSEIKDTLPTKYTE